MQYYTREAMREYHGRFLSKSEKYQAVIKYLKKNSPDTWASIYATIL
jgi:hypothetical protein